MLQFPHFMLISFIRVFLRWCCHLILVAIFVYNIASILNFSRQVNGVTDWSKFFSFTKNPHTKKLTTNFQMKIWAPLGNFFLLRHRNLDKLSEFIRAIWNSFYYSVYPYKMIIIHTFSVSLKQLLVAMDLTFSFSFGCILTKMQLEICQPEIIANDISHWWGSEWHIQSQVHSENNTGG